MFILSILISFLFYPRTQNIPQLPTCECRIFVPNSTLFPDGVLAAYWTLPAVAQGLLIG